MGLFNLFRRRRPARPACVRASRRPGPRLGVECLDDRVLLATFFVVDPAQANGRTTFATLQSALVIANPGDTIQIELGAQNPSGATPISLTEPGITILGSAAAGPQNLPQYSFDIFSIPPPNPPPPANDIVLANLRLGAVQIGRGLGGSPLPPVQPVLRTTIQNCLIEGNPTTGFQFGVAYAPDAAPSNSTTIIGNTFVTTSGTAPANVILATAMRNPRTNDRVVGNTFISSVPTGFFAGPLPPAALPQLRALVRVDNATAGLEVTGNTFRVTDGVGSSVGVSLTDCVGTVVSGNTFNLAPFPRPATSTFISSSGSVALRISDSPSAAMGGDGNQVFVTVANNVFNTDFSGTGVQSLRTNTNTMRAITTYRVSLSGNSFRGNLIGVFVSGRGTGGVTAAQDFGQVDLGGGPLGSGGGNDFINFLGQTVLPNNVAVQTRNGGIGGPGLQAQNNLFSAFTPTGVIDAEPGTTIITTPFFSGFPAALRAMFQDFLRRLPTADEAAVLTVQFNMPGPMGGAAGVARSIVRSEEAYSVLIQRLYRELLGRPADAVGGNFFFQLLQTGATQEEVIARIVSSAEYYNRAAQSFPGGSPNAAWVRALYRDLIGRQADAFGLQFWIDEVAARGVLGVARNFVGTAEFQAAQVATLYGQLPTSAFQAPNLLHRRNLPTAAELAFWANSGFGLLEIQIALLASSEYINSP